ncbi:MAG: YqaE/Pmp3 family membrane protein [Bacteroidia bacterium]
MKGLLFSLITFLFCSVTFAGVNTVGVPTPVSTQTSVSTSIPSPAKMTVKEKKEMRKEVVNRLKNIKADDNQLVEILLAIFIPPVAVYMHQNGITKDFWIDLILCLLFWLPGQIYALYVVLKK